MVKRVILRAIALFLRRAIACNQIDRNGNSFCRIASKTRRMQCWCGGWRTWAIR
ncbi:MAG: hypothetical protein Fur0046_27720 [Cyanobacteria bacterium J069]